MNQGISQSLFVMPALAQRHSQVHPQFPPALQRTPKLITITPIVLLYQSSEIPVTPVPVVRFSSYPEGRPEYPPRVWYFPEIDASKFALHNLSDTPGVFQRLKYILLMWGRCFAPESSSIVTWTCCDPSSYHYRCERGNPNTSSLNRTGDPIVAPSLSSEENKRYHSDS